MKQGTRIDKFKFSIREEEMNRIEDFEEVMDSVIANIAKNPDKNWDDIPEEVENIFSQYEVETCQPYGDWNSNPNLASAFIANLPSHVFNMCNKKEVQIR